MEIRTVAGDELVAAIPALAQDISLPDLGQGGFHLRVLVLGEQFQDSGAAERI